MTRQNRRITALVLALATMGMATAACSGDDDAPSNASPDSSTPATPTTSVGADGETLASIESRAHTRLELASPDWLAADDEFVYVKLDGGTVKRIDPETAEVLGITDIGGDLCQGLGTGFGSVWTCHGTDVVRIDPTRDEVVATIPVNKAHQQGNLATGFDRVWVLVGDGSELVGIDPATNQPSAPIALGARGTDLAVDDASVWVISGPDGQLLRVDPTTNQVTDRRDDLDEPLAIDTTAGLWVGDLGATLQIDPATLGTIATIPYGPGRDGALIAGPTEMWIRTDDPFLRHVDLASQRLIETLTADVTSAGDIIVAFGALWTSAYNDGALFRLPLDDQ